MRILINLFFLFFLFSQRIEVVELGFRKSEPGQTQYSPDCMQKVSWTMSNSDSSGNNHENKSVAGAMVLIRPTFTNSFLKDKAGLSLDRDVPISEAELISKGGGELGMLTLYLADKSEIKLTGSIFNMEWSESFTQQEIGIETRKEVIKNLLQQTQDVSVRVEGSLGSYEQIIPVEVIQEFSEFYTECLN